MLKKLLLSHALLVPYLEQQWALAPPRLNLQMVILSYLYSLSFVEVFRSWFPTAHLKWEQFGWFGPSYSLEVFCYQRWLLSNLIQWKMKRRIRPVHLLILFSTFLAGHLLLWFTVFSNRLSACNRSGEWLSSSMWLGLLPHSLSSQYLSHAAMKR